jgi:O-antigen/teichoic acid export membrane protein
LIALGLEFDASMTQPLNSALDAADELAAPEDPLTADSAASPEAAGGLSPTLANRLAGLLALGNSKGGKTAFRASAWSATGYGVTTGLRFISRLVLAKLLTTATPMGDVAIVVVILAGLEMVSDLGIGFGIVQHKQADESAYVGTAYSVQALRGVLLWALASAFAFPVAWIYHDRELAPLLLFGALSTLFRAFASPGIWLFTRRMDLRRPTLITIVSEIFGFMVTIAWVMATPSAWAIVGGTVAAAATYAVGSHLVGARAKFSWDRDMARDIIHFGGWMLLSSGTYFLSSRGEGLMLRGSVPDAEFGCFAFATMLVTTPVSAITQLASQVFFPMLAAAIRDNRQRAERQFKRGKWAFTAVALCFVWGAIFVGPVIITLMRLPRAFEGLYWMVPLLGLRASLDIFAAPTGSVLFAAGASRYSAWANVVRLVALVGGLYATVGHWGLRGAIWVLVGAPAISYLALLPGVRRLMPGALRVELASLGVFWIGAAIALAIHFSA